MHALGGLEFGVGQAFAVTLQAPWQLNETVILLINCGEGVRRHCNELRLKMRHLAAVCFTSGAPPFTSGLSSVLFHLSDAGCQSVQFLGPCTANHSLDAAMEVFGRKFPVVSRDLSSCLPASFSSELLLSHVHQLKLDVTTTPIDTLTNMVHVCIQHRSVMQKSDYEVLADFKIDDSGTISAPSGASAGSQASDSDSESVDSSSSEASSSSSSSASSSSGSTADSSSSNAKSDLADSAKHSGPEHFVPVMVSPPVPLLASYQQQHFLAVAASALVQSSCVYSPPYLPARHAALLHAAQEAAELHTQGHTLRPNAGADDTSACVASSISPATIGPASASAAVPQGGASNAGAAAASEGGASNAGAAASLRAMLRKAKGVKRPRSTSNSEHATSGVLAAAVATPGGAQSTPSDAANTHSAAQSQYSAVGSMPAGAIDVRVLGTGAATPSALRGNTAVLLSSSVAPTAPGMARQPVQVLLDCGEGTSSLLARQAHHILSRGPMQAAKGAAVPAGLTASFALLLRQLRCVWISHHHADHMSGLHLLLHLRAAAAQPGDAPLTVIVPRTLLRAVQRMSHTLPQGAMQWQEHLAGGGLVLARGGMGEGIALQGVNVRHCHRAQGAVVDFNIFGAHRRVSFSGDTMPCERLARASAGCHLLLHEATFHTDEQQAAKKHHSTTAQAIQAAAASNAGALVLMHFSQRFSQAGPNSPPLVEGAGGGLIPCAPAYDGLCVPLHSMAARDSALQEAHAAHTAWIRYCDAPAVPPPGPAAAARGGADSLPQHASGGEPPSGAAASTVNNAT